MMKDLVQPMIQGARPHIFILTALVFLVGCKTTEVASSWADHVMDIDGSSEDWQNYPLTFFEEERISIGISNDSSYAYVLLRTNDPALIGGIRRSGIILWLDADGGKDKERGIQYIGGPAPQEMEEAGIQNRPEGLEQRDNRMPTNKMPRDTALETRFAFIDHSQGFEEIVFLKDNRGPEIAYGFENGLCVYELRIPLTENGTGVYGMAAGPGQTVEICAEYTVMSMGDRPRPMGGNSGGMPGGGPPGGGPGGGGMRPGGGMKGGPPGEAAGEEKDIWMKTQLAVPQ